MIQEKKRTDNISVGALAAEKVHGYLSCASLAGSSHSFRFNKESQSVSTADAFVTGAYVSGEREIANMKSINPPYVPGDFSNGGE